MAFGDVAGDVGARATKKSLQVPERLEKLASGGRLSAALLLLLSSRSRN